MWVNVRKLALNALCSVLQERVVSRDVNDHLAARVTCALVFVALTACGRAGFRTRDAGGVTDVEHTIDVVPTPDVRRDVPSTLDVTPAFADIGIDAELDASVEPDVDLPEMDAGEDVIDTPDAEAISDAQLDAASSEDVAIVADVEELDASPDVSAPDASEPDASELEDVAVDTYQRDVAYADCGMPVCVPTGAESCNGLDDDCNGSADEGGVCGALTCVPITLYGGQYVACTGAYTWAAAVAHCTTLGGELLNPVGETDRRGFGAAVTAHARGTWTYYWTAANDLACEGQWNVDGVLIDNEGWAGGEPNGGTGENCTALNVSGGGPTANVRADLFCHARGNFICHMSGVSTFPPFVRQGDCSPPVAPPCPGNTELCNGIDDDCNTMVDEGSVCAPRNCVARSIAELGGANALLCTDLLTHQSARASCQAQGLHLANVSTAALAAELAAVFSPLGTANEAWIDGDDRACEGTWVDETGTPLPYTPFAPGEPNNGNGGDGEHCITFYVTGGRASQLNDNTCEERLLPYICTP